MMDSNPGPRPGGIGDNSGDAGRTLNLIVETIDSIEDTGLRNEFEARFETIAKQHEKLQRTAKTIPAVIPEDQITEVGDFLKAVKEHIAELGAVEKKAKKPFKRIVDSIGGFFKKMDEESEEVKIAVGGRFKSAQDTRTARIRREEEQRLEAERKERERKAAEEQARLDAARKAAEEARQKEEAAAKARQAEIDRLDQERREREAKAQRDREEHERKIKEAEAALAAAAAKEAENKRQQAQQQRRAQEAIDRAKADAEAAEKQRQQDRAAAEAEAQRKRREHEKQAEEAAKQTRIATRAAGSAEKASDRAGAQLATVEAKQDKLANTSDAEMSHVRGELGSLNTQREHWKALSWDRATLDLEAIRQHLPEDGIERALNAFVRAGGRELRGAVIEKDTILVTR